MTDDIDPSVHRALYYNCGTNNVEYPTPEGLRSVDLRGYTGPQGRRGPRGLQGEKGDRGDRGPQGFAGPAGQSAPIIADAETYDSFNILMSGEPEPIQGPPGPEGPQGPAGPQGLQGPQGIQGATGPEGPAHMLSGNGDGVGAIILRTEADYPTRPFGNIYAGSAVGQSSGTWVMRGYIGPNIPSTSNCIRLYHRII